MNEAAVLQTTLTIRAPQGVDANLTFTSHSTGMHQWLSVTTFKPTHYSDDHFKPYICYSTNLLQSQS